MRGWPVCVLTEKQKPFLGAATRLFPGRGNDEMWPFGIEIRHELVPFLWCFLLGEMVPYSGSCHH